MPSPAITSRSPLAWPVILGGLHEVSAPPATMSEPASTAAESAAQGVAALAATALALVREQILAALAAGETGSARQMLARTVAEFPGIRFAAEWVVFWDLSAWPDAWLIAAVRRDPPDEPALDALADRHWRNLFARCHLLALDRDKAADLAQDAWCRILRSRHALRADGNFPAYLATVATNLWRDRYRAERRAGAMADGRMLSLDAALPTAEGEGSFLGDLLPDLEGLAASEQAKLKLDIDQALEQLPPVLRDVLIARFLGGESCAEIGRRYGRTEQTVSGWVRQAITELRRFFLGTGRTFTPTDLQR